MNSHQLNTKQQNTKFQYCLSKILTEADLLLSQNQKTKHHPTAIASVQVLVELSQHSQVVPGLSLQVLY